MFLDVGSKVFVVCGEGNLLVGRHGGARRKGGLFV